MPTRSGCTHYIQATATVYFPEEDIRCSLCPCLSANIVKMPYCTLTGEIIGDTRTIGYECPLNFKEEENT